MAIIHYQFEAIHPFFDGNGRTGRIILLLYLKMTGLLHLPALYLSDYIIQHKSAYYKNLRAVTEKQDWEKWIYFMLDMIEQTSLKGREQIATIERLMNTMAREIQDQLPKVFSKDLLEVLFHLPYAKRSFLVEAGIGNLKTAGNYLSLLEQNRFSEKRSRWKRKTIFEYPFYGCVETKWMNIL